MEISDLYLQLEEQVDNFASLGLENEFSDLIKNVREIVTNSAFEPTPSVKEWRTKQYFNEITPFFLRKIPPNADVTRKETMKQNVRCRDLFATTGNWNDADDKALKSAVTKTIKEGLKEDIQQEYVEDSSEENLQKMKKEISKMNKMKRKELREAYGGTVDWGNVVQKMGTKKHTPVDCRNRWANYVDPSIRREKWTKVEEAKLMKLVQERGGHDWVSITEKLGSRRSVMDVFTHFQRGLNPSVLKTVWSKEEDDRLIEAVNVYGLGDWLAVSAMLPRRTKAQCMHRYWKRIKPGLKKQVKYSTFDDWKLRMATKVYDRKWNYIAGHFSGRSDQQCRERMVDILEKGRTTNSPRNGTRFTKKEDTLLLKIVKQYGSRPIWSEVADKMKNKRSGTIYRRRWTLIGPSSQVRKYKDARKSETGFTSKQGRNFLTDEDLPRLTQKEVVLDVPPSITPKSSMKRKAQDSSDEEEDGGVEGQEQTIHWSEGEDELSDDDEGNSDSEE
eukprot:TRINITY_DN28443_c0_g1_i1.p1 TRINITY_DN28443_c0_g1~~TRINITY_DN28443_c0_g1_i1.p1  ORF type:complete len:502 (-),score=135.17 TRINITY_DN28443_c0_g1_i1:235-1740(-)